jgi:hypothetical protein
MSLSEGLFAPKLNMRWKWRGTRFDLLRDDEVIWSSVMDWQPRWEYVSKTLIARTLNKYINTPVEKLRRKELEHILPSFYEVDVKANLEKLLRIMIAADRRIGKNTISVWLFVEPDITIRNIIGARL